MNILHNDLQLRSGKYFNLLSPQPGDFTLTDIAHGLSNICRFVGQSKTFYSVAEHSVLCASLVPDELKLTALLHDASEAFIGDVSAPLKQYLSEYKKIEYNIMTVIFKKYGCVYPFASPAIKQSDLTMLAAERAELLTEQDMPWPILEGMTAADCFPRILCLSPVKAKRMFLYECEKCGLEIDKS